MGGTWKAPSTCDPGSLVGKGKKGSSEQRVR